MNVHPNCCLPHQVRFRDRRVTHKQQIALQTATDTRRHSTKIIPPIFLMSKEDVIAWTIIHA